MDKMKPCHPMTLKEDIKDSMWRKIHEEAEARITKLLGEIERNLMFEGGFG